MRWDGYDEEYPGVGPILPTRPPIHPTYLPTYTYLPTMIHEILGQGLRFLDFQIQTFKSLRYGLEFLLHGLNLLHSIL